MAVASAAAPLHNASRGPSYFLTSQPTCSRGCTDGDTPAPCRDVTHGAGPGWLNPLNLASAAITNFGTPGATR
jgi:hypothetical protein